MSEKTSPSASQQPLSDDIRIKRLERELADAKSQLDTAALNHAKSLDEIDKLETDMESLKATIALKNKMVQSFMDVKKHDGAELAAALASKNRPEVSGEDDKVVEQLQAKVLELQNTNKKLEELNEKKEERNEELRGRVQKLDLRIAQTDSYLGRIERQMKHMTESAEYVTDGLASSRKALGLSPKPSEVPAGFELPVATALSATRASLHTSDDEVQRSENSDPPPYAISGAVEAIDPSAEKNPGRGARSSAETELLRLKERETLSRLTPF